MQERIDKAIDLAISYGGIDGDHHKAWVIDQIVRALTGCPMVKASSRNADGSSFGYEEQGESEQYAALVQDARDGKDGPETYSWNVGIAP